MIDMTTTPQNSEALALPPLPKAEVTIPMGWVRPGLDVYTADQMNERWADGWKAGYKHGAWADWPAVGASSVPVAWPNGFLADVMTAAGLVRNGSQCKALAERLGNAVMIVRGRATATQARAAESEPPEASEVES